MCKLRFCIELKEDYGYELVNIIQFKSTDNVTDVLLLYALKNPSIVL